MAVSGNQKTRIGPGLPAVGIKITITAKAESGITTTVLDFGRGLMRGLMRGFVR
jgi:hypothetical protein